MKKTYLDALMSIFTPIPLNNGFYFVDNNGTIDCKHSKKCTFYTLRFGCSFAAVNTIKPQLL